MYAAIHAQGYTEFHTKRQGHALEICEPPTWCVRGLAPNGCEGWQKKKALIEMQREQQRLLVEKSREDERHRRAETEAKRKILQRAQGRQVCERAMCWCDRI
jgi:hypothetical protein